MNGIRGHLTPNPVFFYPQRKTGLCVVLEVTLLPVSSHLVGGGGITSQIHFKPLSHSIISPSNPPAPAICQLWKRSWCKCFTSAGNAIWHPNVAFKCFSNTWNSLGWQVTTMVVQAGETEALPDQQSTPQSHRSLELEPLSLPIAHWASPASWSGLLGIKQAVLGPQGLSRHRVPMPLGKGEPAAIQQS